MRSQTGKQVVVIEQERRAESDWSSHWQKCAPCKWSEEGSQWLWCPAAYKILPLTLCLSTLPMLTTSLFNSQKCVKLSVLKSHLIAGTSLALTIQVSSLYRINGVVHSFIQHVRTCIVVNRSWCNSWSQVTARLNLQIQLFFELETLEFFLALGFLP